MQDSGRSRWVSFHAVPAVWAIVVALCLAVTIFHDGWVGRTFAVIIGLVGFLALRHGGYGRRFSRWLSCPTSSLLGARPRSEIVAEIFCPLLVLGVVLGIFYRVFLGETPLGSDHPLHLNQAWVMSDLLLPSGRLTGWIHERGAGYPAGVLYPIGANLLVAVFRLVLPDSVSWLIVYAVGFLVAMAFCHLAMYLSGRIVAGPWAGMVAGLASALDHGSYRQSGWTFAVQVGVWPVSLSMAEALLGVVLLNRALLGGGPCSVAAEDGAGAPQDPPQSNARLLVLAAILLGLSIFTHPMSVAFLGLALPVVILHAALEAERRSMLGVAVRGAFFAALGVALSAFWLVPFLAFREWARPLGTGSVTIMRQAQGVVLLNFFGNMWYVTAALALIGGIAVWRRRLPTGRFLTLLFALIALAVNGTTLVHFELDRWFERLSNVQPDRFYLYLRPSSYILAGVGAVWVVRKVGNAISERAGDLRKWGLRVLACVAFGAFLMPIGESLFWDVVSPRGRWTQEPDDYHYYVKTAEFIRDHARARTAEHRGFVRTTWPIHCPGWMGGGNHCFESSPVYTGIGQVHPAYHSAAAFKGLFGLMDKEGSSELLHSLGVRYSVTTRSRRRGTELFRSGKLIVYELGNVAEGPFTVSGQAKARLLSFEHERIRIDVKNAGPLDRLTLHIPYFPNWHAYIDGREIPLDTVPIEGITEAMALPLTNGTLELRYERGGPELLGKIVSIAGLLCCFLLLIGRWPLPSRWVDRLADLGARVAEQLSAKRRLLVGVGVAVTSLFALGVGWSVWGRFWEDRPRFDTVLDFEDARVWSLEQGRRRICHRTWTEAWRCGSGLDKLVSPTYVWTRMGETHGAIRAHPLPNAELHIDFPRVKLGAALVGGMGIAHSGSGRSKVRLQVRANGREINELYFTKSRGWVPFHCDTSESAGEEVRLEFVISARKTNRRHFIFRAWTVDDVTPRPLEEAVQPVESRLLFGEGLPGPSSEDE